ncbi:MAG: Uma2 family endonuclease [Emticicia sp.]|nr:Uma2 family endonuclease [Emticicia sp.]
MTELIELKYDRFRLSDDEFYDFCTQNDSLKFERDAKGNIIIMPNTGGITGNLNFELNIEFGIWNRQAKLGKGFDSSTTFRLPSTAARSADVAWVSNEVWDELDLTQQTKFPPVCPEFVIELMSNTDSLKDAQKKMSEEWIANGCKLAWLINPKTQKTYIFRPKLEMETVVGFDKKLFGEDVLVGFELDLGILK